MRGPSRIGSLTLVAWMFAEVAACAPSADVRRCATADECPVGARCISGTCVANAPPSMAVAVPASPQANALLSFDASASADHDPGDAIVSFAWTFHDVSGVACPPPVVAGTGAAANVRFGCAGRYAVDVTGTDRMGATSTATAEFDVAVYDGPALLTVNADIPLQHVCSAVPRCTPDGPVALSASTPTIAFDQVSFAWSVEPPPDRPLASYRRVAFSPSALVASPTVAIDTDGEAISGDWIFRVTATDAAGVVGTAVTRVSIGNRLPTVTKTIPAVLHTFASSTFTAQDVVPFAVVDPDGDALLGPAVEARHTGDGGAPFVATIMQGPPRVTFSITVPYAVPDDALHLIGGAGLERTIVFDVSDVNGGRTVESWPIVVGNRPPAVTEEPTAFLVEHSYDPVARAYVAETLLSKWSDPDGDPMFRVPGSDTGDPDCPDFVVEGAARVRCRLPFAGTPAVANFAGTHTVTQAVQDPWTAAASTSTVSFVIGNRAPVITSATAFVVDACLQTASCCRVVEGICDVNWAVPVPSVSVPSRWNDPDGDPISVEVSAAGSYTPEPPIVCVPAECVLDVAIGQAQVCASTAPTYLPTAVSDGLSSTTGSLPMQVTCP